MKAVMLVKDPEAFQLLADDTRRRMIHLLRVKERTVSQIAEEIGLTPQAIYHHVRKLKDAGLIEVAREERVDHFIETYYRAAAEVFHMSHGEGTNRKMEEQQTFEALQHLSKLGIEVKADVAVAARVVDIKKKMSDLGCGSECEEKIESMQDVDFFGKQALLEYAGYLMMTDEKFEEHLRLFRQLRKTLKSGIQNEGRARAKKT
jgi:DNA-binding transcriptional ArsR family regulator